MSIQREERLGRVCAQVRQTALLQTAADTLEWDERTGMPRLASDYRADQVASLRRLVHERRTDRRLGDDLEELSGQFADDDPHGAESTTVRELLRDWKRDWRLPVDLVAEISHATVRGQHVWDASRKADDFMHFASSLKRIVSLKREAGEAMALGGDIYEALADEYEPGAKVAQWRNVLEELREPLVAIVSEFATKDGPLSHGPTDAPLRAVTSIDRQRQLSRSVAAAVGFDFDRGRLDETSHPFCTNLGPNDCRILTRFDPKWLPAGLYGTLHEAGHAMYDQGLPTQWYGLPPGSYVSLGIHESQSRLWENLVGRSRAFCQWIQPLLGGLFPRALGDLTVDGLYRAVNVVAPSLIRVEADEATYNLHIIVRFQLETDLIAGTLDVEDLPAAWNEAYEKNFGIRPPSDASGVLQDVHWSAGLFGYFPTYTLGNLAAAQLHEAAKVAIGNLDVLIASGNFRPLLEWLREHIHRHGRCFSSAELILNATGKALSADALLHSLRQRQLELRET